MDARTETRVADWETRPFDGGYTGLRRLADTEFSGAITVGSAWLFMLNGRTIGVFDGTIDEFEGADGTAHTAPDPALSLLFVMLERDGETRAQYYTEDTPLSEVDATLSEGGFTGYLELSENVLSGDYYVVYQGGRSMSVAFVGNSGRLVTGDEAFEKASDEVGIYEVCRVDIRVVDLPEPPSDPDREPADAAIEPSGTDTAPDRSVEAPKRKDESEATADAVDGPDEPPIAGPDEPVDATASSDDPRPEEDEPFANDEAASSDAASSATSRQAAVERAAASEPADDQSDSEDVVAAEDRRSGVNRIPSLNPDRTEEREDPQPASTPSSEGESATEDDEHGGVSSADERSSESNDRDDGPDERLADLRERLATAQTERDDAEREADRLRAEVRELQERVERLETDRPEPDTERTLDPADALEGTNLFVRYDSKGQPTLEAAHAGQADPEAVNRNLKLEHHTQFDADAVAVGGQPFEEFLEGTTEYRFVNWLIRELLYEIRDTGHASGLADLFDALPTIDRAELAGGVQLRYVEDGEEYREEHAFDVVVRDRMGNPIVVADLNDSREPATEEMTVSLVEAANRTKETNDSLAGAVLVTTSFFDPGALETAADATSSGFLGGGSRESFVKFSRKRGYHLCLVEGREGEFHVTVPEL